jgi:hypothetical protein
MREYKLKPYFRKRGLQDMLGEVFEHVIAQTFPVLEKQSQSTERLPDFLMPGKFYLEAKTAFGGFGFSPSTGRIFKTDSKTKGYYGVQIKQYQVESFNALNESSGLPVLYVFGYHGVYDSTKRFAQVQDKSDFIIRNFVTPHIYFCSSSFVHAVFEKEKRLSQKARAYHEQGEEIPSPLPKWYMSLKKNLLDQAISGVTSKESVLIPRRVNGAGSVLEKVDLFSYYGISQNSYVTQSSSPNIEIPRQTKFAFLTKGGILPISVSYLVNQDEESCLESFLAPYLVR